MSIGIVRRAVAVVVVGLLAVTAGCTTGTPAKAPDGVDRVTYLTAVASFGREAYAWVALEKGFFRDRNIEVEIKPGQGSADNLKLLAAGQAQFSANDLSGVMVMLGEGNHKGGVRAVAAIQQRTLNSITVLRESGITVPADLVGKKIGGVPGGAPMLLWPAYAKLAGIDPASVQWLNVPAQQTPATLASGKVDGIGQFTVARGTVERAAQGRPVHLLPYSDVIADLYGNALIAPTRLIEEDPDLVRRFSEALLEGLVYSIDHPEEAGQILHKHVPSADPQAAAQEVALMQPYVLSNARAGVLDPERIARAIAVLQGAGVIPAGLTPADVIASGFAPA
ncbi:ABC transporter substrate-binding protein [Polymorphospora rubra]|uniref:Nitrate ABC transporter substrate-binding protein n=1 Tax=Polymorphospora rubra TaxID=338584 RepID=A0A810MZ27_9ACTN|nr:ABC transporter substrate-binding protein [Polymorphospora rubra]BCJ65714.1 nitrate ABC transporter substrate-binding protein [Polymorphospora rubra]